MAQFVVTNLYQAPSISDDGVWEAVINRTQRDYPWLLSEDHEICLSGLGNSWSGWQRRDRIVSHAGFRSTSSFPLNAALAWFTHFADILRLARKGSVTALVPSAEAGLGATMAKMLAKHRVQTVVRVTSHIASKSLYVNPSRWRYKFIKGLERFVLRRADLVVPMGNFTNEIVRSHGVEADKVVVLQFPVPWVARAEITDPPLVPTVLTAARLVKEKGVQVLLDAMPLVLKSIPNARLLIAGEGSYRSTLEQLAASLGVQDKVSFLGWLNSEELGTLYRETSLFSMPSLCEEGMGMVFVEAGLVGRPVVGSDRGGIRDIIYHGQNGLLVPPGDSVALAEAIITILKDRELAWRMGLAGHKLAQKYVEAREAAVEIAREEICRLVRDEGMAGRESVRSSL